MTAEAKPREEPAIVRKARECDSHAHPNLDPRIVEQVNCGSLTYGDCRELVVYLDRLASGTGENKLDRLIDECGGADSFESALAWPRLMREQSKRLRSDLAAAKLELDRIHSLKRWKSEFGTTAAELDEELQKADDAIERAGYTPGTSNAAYVIDDLRQKLESTRSRPSVSAGERPSDEELRKITEHSWCSADGRRALFDAGVARGEAKRAESVAKAHAAVKLARRCVMEVPTRQISAMQHLDKALEAIECLQPAPPKEEPARTDGAQGSEPPTVERLTREELDDCAVARAQTSTFVSVTRAVFLKLLAAAERDLASDAEGGGEELAIEAVAAELWRLCARESAAFRSGQHAAIPAIRVALMMARDRRGGGR